MYTCNLFFLNYNIEFESYTDDTTPFIYGENFDQILSDLENDMSRISKWFLHNCLKVNAKKLYLFLSFFVDKTTSINDFIMKSSNTEVLLRIKIDISLSFSNHVAYLFPTLNCKLHAL